jgi:hypothetical protein
MNAKKAKKSKSLHRGKKLAAQKPLDSFTITKTADQSAPIIMK